MTSPPTPRSAGSASTIFVRTSIARTTAARPGTRSPPVCRQSAGQCGARRSGAARACCTRAPRRGVWVSFDDGDHWQSLQLNLPHTSMRDLVVHDDDLIVATHGRAFWILDDISPLRQIKPADSNASCSTRAAYRVRRSTSTPTRRCPRMSRRREPSRWRNHRLLFAVADCQGVSLEILRRSRHTVRRYRSTDKPEISEEDLEKQLHPLILGSSAPQSCRPKVGMSSIGYGTCTQAPLPQLRANRISHRQQSRA